MKEVITLVIYHTAEDAMRYVNNNLMAKYGYNYSLQRSGRRPIEFTGHNYNHVYQFISDNTPLSNIEGRTFHKYITLYGTNISIEVFKQLEMTVKIAKHRTKS